MEFLSQEKKKSGSRGMILGAAFLIGALLIGGGIWLISLSPSATEKKQSALEGAFREGSADFEKYTKGIVIETDQARLRQWMTGLGTKTLSAAAKVKNYTDRNLIGLELVVTVIDLEGKPMKEKPFLVVPGQAEKLGANQVMPVTCQIEGFEKDSDPANFRWKVTAIKVE